MLLLSWNYIIFKNKLIFVSNIACVIHLIASTSSKVKTPLLTIAIATKWIGLVVTCNSVFSRQKSNFYILNFLNSERTEEVSGCTMMFIFFHVSIFLTTTSTAILVILYPFSLVFYVVCSFRGRLFVLRTFSINA